VSHLKQLGLEQLPVCREPVYLKVKEHVMDQEEKER
jgi:hypothetical protein